MGGGENPTYSLIFSKMFLFLSCFSDIVTDVGNINILRVELKSYTPVL